MATFGHTTMTVAYTAGANIATGCFATCSSDGTGNSINVNTWAISGTTHIQAALYSSDLSTKIAETEEITITTTETTYTLNFTSSPSLTASTEYFIVFKTEASAGFRYGVNSPDSLKYNISMTYANAWPSSISGGSTQGNYAMNIYVDYTEASATPTSINIGDTWKEIDWANSSINIGDTWKAIAGVAINIGDTWKTVYGTP